MSARPQFKLPSDATGLDIIDPVETRHFTLFTDSPVDPVPADADEFVFPVDTACEISPDELRLPYMIPVDVRTPEGDPQASIDSATTREFADGEYLLELHSPIKVYLRVFGAFGVEATAESVELDFSEATRVEVGARSYHSSPAATITVPDDPEAMMKAVSAFSSALKTTSPERAWPTLRGHPPRIERGDELSIPDDLEVPATRIRITVPAEYWAVYTVAPLAYYLGAKVVSGDSAHVTAENGVAHHLGDDPEELNDAVEALLERVFFLDCVIRTEGLYPDDLHEREVLESRVDLDFPALYDATPAERLEAYLSVPDEAVDAISSPWHRVTHVEPEPETVELLAAVVNDLSLVRAKVTSDEPSGLTETEQELNDEINSFFRSPGGREATAGGDFVRSAEPQSPPLRRNGGTRDDDKRDATRGVPDLGEYVSLPETDALEQAWVGDGTPIRGTKLIPEAFARETPEPSDGTIEITAVCNDERMRDELDSVGEIYGSRDDMRVSVTCEFGVSTTELHDLLAEDCDVFHFIGHIDGRGFQCHDGVLDAGTVEETNATTALLNGCRSHDQGVELVKAGASAAIVSLSDLFNSGAVEVGETLARLLHHGFDIGSSMKIVREYTSIGNRYVVVGDPGVVVAQCERLLPTIYRVVEQHEDRTTLTLEPYSYSVGQYGIGSVLKPFVRKSERYQIAVGDYANFRIPRTEFQDAIVGAPEPLIVNGSLVWSDAWFTNF